MESDNVAFCFVRSGLIGAEVLTVDQPIGVAQREGIFVLADVRVAWNGTKERSGPHRADVFFPAFIATAFSSQVYGAENGHLRRFFRIYVRNLLVGLALREKGVRVI